MRLAPATLVASRLALREGVPTGFGRIATYSTGSVPARSISVQAVEDLSLCAFEIGNADEITQKFMDGVCLSTERLGGSASLDLPYPPHSVDCKKTVATRNMHTHTTDSRVVAKYDDA